MGIDNSINKLKNDGFVIESDGNNYTISFPENKAEIWEKYISKHLEIGYWNEYLTDKNIVFLFHLKEGIKRFEVYNYENAEVINLCNKLCNCKFVSIKSMLSNNSFYKDKLN